MGKGEITHIEFPADDVERAKQFYAAVAGWEFSQPEGFAGYYMFRNGEASGGAVAKRGYDGYSQRLQFRCDGLDAFNHFNLGNPNATIADTRDGGLPVPTAGKITGGSGNRIIQLGLKYMF